jgi:LysR family transcriptional regulator, glycine cleavage system transcriptional activator
VQDALDRLAIGTSEVFGRRRTEALTIRCAVSFAVNWLAPRLPDYIRRHPDRPLRILSSVWSGAFDANAYDLDIQYGKGPWPGLTSHRLTWEKLAPLCAPASAKRLRTPADLQHETLLHVLGYQEGWGIWLQAAKTKRVEPGQGLHLDTSLAAFALAATGTGVALGRSSLAATDLAAGRLVAPFQLSVPVDEAFHLLAAPTSLPHPHAASFKDWLIATAAQDLDNAPH